MDSSLSPSDFLFLREEIRHEDNLVNQRVAWLVSSQSFLLTAFAIALNSPAHARFPHYERLNATLIAVIPIAGVVICLVSVLTILAGVLHMRQIRRLAGAFHPQHLPGVQGTVTTRLLGVSGPVLAPVILLVVWLVLLRL